jgi:predicted DNA-binding antitoxin AbrB/MazE fold protein
MIHRGRVKNGVVLFEEPVNLPEGAEVRVELVRPGPQQEAIKLIDQWLADQSGYDEQSWPELKTDMERDRLSSRRRFDE